MTSLINITNCIKIDVFLIILISFKWKKTITCTMYESRGGVSGEILLYNNKSLGVTL